MYTTLIVYIYITFITLAAALTNYLAKKSNKQEKIVTEIRIEEKLTRTTILFGYTDKINVNIYSKSNEQEQIERLSGKTKKKLICYTFYTKEKNIRNCK